MNGLTVYAMIVAAKKGKLKDYVENCANKKLEDGLTVEQCSSEITLSNVKSGNESINPAGIKPNEFMDL